MWIVYLIFTLQRINAQFENMLPVGQEKVDHLKHTDGGVVNGEEDHQVPSIHFAQGKLLISHFTVVILVLLTLSLTTINL